MTRRSSRFAAAALAALALSSFAIDGALARSQVGDVRVATARFHSLTAAGKANYGPFPAGVPLHDCISSLDNSGAMGFHWVNGNLLDITVDATRPEVLVYAPDSRGELRLAAVEYVVFQEPWDAVHGANNPPSLFGMDFMSNNGVRFQIPPFYALHAWIWQSNPSDMFAPFNPNVSCGDASAASGKGSATATSAAARMSTTGARTWACRVPVATA